VAPGYDRAAGRTAWPPPSGDESQASACATTSGSNSVPAPGRAVVAVAAQGVDDVGDGDDPCGERDRAAREAARVPRPVPALVVGEGDLGRELQEQAAAPAEHGVAGLAVPLDQRTFGGRQRPRLGEDGGRDRHLPDVVQAGGELELWRVATGDAHALGDGAGDVPDAVRVVLAFAAVEAAVLGELGQVADRLAQRQREQVQPLVGRLRLHPGRCGFALRTQALRLGEPARVQQVADA
jgi:hypothetical protein